MIRGSLFLESNIAALSSIDTAVIHVFAQLRRVCILQSHGLETSFLGTRRSLGNRSDL